MIGVKPRWTARDLKILNLIGGANEYAHRHVRHVDLSAWQKAHRSGSIARFVCFYGGDLECRTRCLRGSRLRVRSFNRSEDEEGDEQRAHSVLPSMRRTHNY